MTKQEQIEEMAVIGCVRNPQAHTAEECAKCDFKQGQCNAYRHAEALYNAGYRKTFTSDLASDTQNAFKDGYIRGNIDGMLLARKQTAKEIFTKLIEVAKNNDNKLSIGLLKAWAIEFDVGVKE